LGGFIAQIGGDVMNDTPQNPAVSAAQDAYRAARDTNDTTTLRVKECNATIAALEAETAEATASNDAEIDARATAIAEGVQRPDLLLIDIASLDERLAVQRALAVKLGAILAECRAKHQGAADELKRVRDGAALAYLQHVGASRASRLSFEKFADFKLGELLELAELQNFRAGSAAQWNFSDFLATIRQPMPESRKAARAAGLAKAFES
jgi:hypothetical protein